MNIIGTENKRRSFTQSATEEIEHYFAKYIEEGTSAPLGVCRVFLEISATMCSPEFMEKDIQDKVRNMIRKKKEADAKRAAAMRKLMAHTKSRHEVKKCVW